MDNSNSPNVPRTCSKCNQVRDRILAKTFKDGSKYYTDLQGKKWLGSTGPCCTYKARQEYYSNVEHAKATCQICNTEYVQKTSTQRYCGAKCSLKASSRTNKKTTAKKMGEA